MVRAPALARKDKAAGLAHRIGLGRASGLEEALAKAAARLAAEADMPTRLSQVGVDQSLFEPWALAVHANKRLPDNAPGGWDVPTLREVLGESI